MVLEAVQEEIGGPSPTIIKVVGCGGAGTNAVNWMSECGVAGVLLYAANTDAQSLSHSKASVKLPIGSKTTKGLGAGSDPKIGEKAAMEDREMVENGVRGADMVFTMAGMGGGTGTGSAPVISQIARECGALVVGVVTKPFEFEGSHKMRIAEEGIVRMREAVDTLIVIPNQHLMKLADRSVNYKNAFHKIDDVLRHAVQSITDLITKNGYNNIDFADVRTAMRDQGDALMGIGIGTGDKRAIDAAVNAMNNPLLEDTSIAGAHNIIINITCGADSISMPEVQEIVDKIRADADEDAVIKFGVVEDESMEAGAVQVTLVATGFQRSVKRMAAKGEGKQEEKRADLFSAEEWDNILTSRTSLQKPRSPLAGMNASPFAKQPLDEDDLDIPAVLREARHLRLVTNDEAARKYG